MAKRKIVARQAVGDIRAGMDDSALMEKYSLSPSGLQSLFDKLVSAGLIDVSEMQDRMPGYLGTVAIADPFAPPPTGRTNASRKGPRVKSSAWINAQEAARDVRSGMDDSALMNKYKVSSKGLQSLFDKLLDVGVITQLDLSRRAFGADHTVDLREDTLSLSHVLANLDYGRPATPTAVTALEAEQTNTNGNAKEKADKVPPRDAKKPEQRPKSVERSTSVTKHPWYDHPLLVILSLIAIFPLGFYALYKNAVISSPTKGLIATVWGLAVILCVLLGWGIV